MSTVQDSKRQVEKTRFTSDIVVRTAAPALPTQVTFIRREQLKVDGLAVSNVQVAKLTVPLRDLLDHRVNVNGVVLTGSQVMAWLQSVSDTLDAPA